ncbi:hypothetical protein PspLS_08134 [Pyricularia sp. CBS 133598]|nr:hypothetical protein PspLS_08134 [Pyricularia sp. CBS 133598]
MVVEEHPAKGNLRKCWILATKEDDVASSARRKKKGAANCHWNNSTPSWSRVADENIRSTIKMGKQGEPIPINFGSCRAYNCRPVGNATGLANANFHISREEKDECSIGRGQTRIVD